MERTDWSLRPTQRLCNIGLGLWVWGLSAAPAVPACHHANETMGSRPAAFPSTRIVLFGAEGDAAESGQDGANARRPNFSISAKVDKTSVEVGSQFTLILTIEGEFAKAKLQPFEFPQALQVVAQSRSTDLSVQLGSVKRSISLVYVLVAREPGQFQLGPYQVNYRGQPFLTDPIEILVHKPVLPPRLEERQRITL